MSKDQRKPDPKPEPDDKCVEPEVLTESGNNGPSPPPPPSVDGG